MIKNGDFVLIRTYSAGVHFGTLVHRDGQEVHLKDARRLWNWNGALSLSEVAMKGIKINDSKISVPVACYGEKYLKRYYASLYAEQSA